MDEKWVVSSDEPYILETMATIDNKSIPVGDTFSLERCRKRRPPKLLSPGSPSNPPKKRTSSDDPPDPPDPHKKSIMKGMHDLLYSRYGPNGDWFFPL